MVLDSGGSLFEGTDHDSTSDDPELGAVIVAAMNAMGYDAMALGERDIGAPLGTLQTRFKEAEFPILSANVGRGAVRGKDALPNVQPYLMRRIGGHTVVIVGVTPATANQRLETLGQGRLAPDIVDAVTRAIKKAGKRADVILLLSTLDRPSTEALAQALPGIDAIIGMYRGWQSQPIALPSAEGEVVLHAAGSNGEHLGVLTLHLNAEGQVTGFEGHASALTDDYVDDPEIIRIMNKYATKP